MNDTDKGKALVAAVAAALPQTMAVALDAPDENAAYVSVTVRATPELLAAVLAYCTNGNAAK